MESVTPLDPIDLHLLALLQRDASRSNLALAQAVGVSPATALRRVRRLVDEGVIERQVALLAPAAVGRQLAALVEVSLDRQGAEHLDAFEARAVAEAAVQQGHAGLPRAGAAPVHAGRQRAQRQGLLQRQAGQV